MIDLETIEREINELEARGDTTYSLCERLAWLYVVRDHLLPPKVAERVPEPAPQELPDLHGSDFLESVNGVGYEALMGVLDEHMSALQVVQPREYEMVMGRIADLRLAP